jgi:hypothetical protein
MQKNFQSRGSRQGSAMVLFGLMLPVLILVVGLAVDLTLEYIVQGQLQTAVDAAANGALRLLQTNANTTEIATEFLKANLPAGYWFSNNLVPTNISATTSLNKHTMTVAAKVDVPVTFLRLLGKKKSTVSAKGVANAWDLVPCTISYPSGTAPALSSVVFNESDTMVSFGPTYVLPHGTIKAWYSDEHALTLGVRRVDVVTATGTTTTDYPFTPYTGSKIAVSQEGPLPVGTTALTGDQAGTDLATWSSEYNYQDHGRPMWPALYVTDITTYTNDTSGDWQQGGTTAVGPNAVYGTWKGAVKTVDYTGKKDKKTGLVIKQITYTVDADPAKNNWTGVPDVPTGGFPACDGWCSEIVWNIDSLHLRPGHTYRLQFMIHDGDQHQEGGDVGQACVIATY